MEIVRVSNSCSPIAMDCREWPFPFALLSFPHIFGGLIFFAREEFLCEEYNRLFGVEDLSVGLVVSPPLVLFLWNQGPIFDAIGRAERSGRTSYFRR